MIVVPRLHIPASELEFRSEIGKLDVVAKALDDVSVDAEHLVYCGAEGEELHTQIETRYTTYGHTYQTFRRLARDEDLYGRATQQNPLQYAFMPEHTSPAIVAYTEADLVEWLPDRWRPCDPTNTLNDVLAAIIFFSE